MALASVSPTVAGSKPKKLLDQTRDVLRLKHYSLRTERALARMSIACLIVRSSQTIPIRVNSMREIRLKVSELFEVDARSGEEVKDLVAITAYVLKHYAFLPKPIIVTLEGDDVLISFPEESDAKKEEAARLADRAVKRRRNAPKAGSTFLNSVAPKSYQRDESGSIAV